VSFGPLSLDRRGIHVADQDAVLAWQDLESLATAGPVLVITRRGSRDAWRMLDAAAVPNLCVLDALTATVTAQR
jgi:hypothetical protein